MDWSGIGVAIMIGRMIAASVSLGGAVFLAYHSRDGWGWLIFAAILLGCVTFKES